MGRTLGAIVVAALLGSAAHGSEIHRVVTTLDANNKSTTLVDETVTLEVGKSGVPGAVIWATDSQPPGFSYTDDGAKKQKGFNPPDNGTVFRVAEFPPLDPATEAKLPPDAMMKVVGDHAPARGVAVTHPLMHRTRTIDYAIVMSGEIDLMLDDKTVHLKPGDVVVQQATNHAWLNRGKEPCRVLIVLMDSKQP